MIELYEGVPGSGKSYNCVKDKFLPWLRHGRRLYVYIEGIYLDRLAAFEGKEEAEFVKQITCWTQSAEVLSGLLNLEPGSAVIIDECQTLFRSQTRVDPEVLRLLEVHRHYGLDLVLMCQDYRQVTQTVTRLVEVTTKFRRLDRVGISNRYQGFVRGNPEETEVIRKWIGKYDPKVYAYYSSYAAAAVKEQRQMKTALGSVTVIAGVCGLGLALCWFLWGNWIGSAAQTAAPASVQKELSANTVMASEMAAPPPVKAVRIVGGVGFVPAGKTEEEWRYLTEDGQMLTVSEVAGLSGGTVSEIRTGSTRKLVGSGVAWLPSEPVTDIASMPGGAEVLRKMGEPSP
jgi:zona occludens toxin